MDLHVISISMYNCVIFKRVKDNYILMYHLEQRYSHDKDIRGFFSYLSSLESQYHIGTHQNSSVPSNYNSVPTDSVPTGLSRFNF